MGGGGSSPSPAQLREPATPQFDTSSPPQTPALAPLVDPLFHWGGGRDAGIQPALVPRQTNALGELEEGWSEDGIESHRNRDKGVVLLAVTFATRLLAVISGPSVKLRRTPARVRTGLRTPRTPPRGHHLREPRPLSVPPAGTGLTCSPPPRLRLRGHRGEDPPGPRGGGLGSPELELFCRETRRAWKSAALPDVGVPLGGALHQAASARGRGAGVRPSGF